jgi:hypothetical protein
MRCDVFTTLKIYITVFSVTRCSLVGIRCLVLQKGPLFKRDQELDANTCAIVSMREGVRKLGKGYRPWRPIGLREVKTPTYLDKRLIDGGKVVSPTRLPNFTPRFLYF